MGDSTAPMSSAAVQGQSEGEMGGAAPVTAAVRITPGMSSPSLDPHLAEDPERQVEPSIEEDHRDAEGEDELRAERVERHVDDVEHRGAEKGAEEDEQKDLGNPSQAGKEACRQCRAQHEAERQKHVAGHDSSPPSGSRSVVWRVRRSPSSAIRATSFTVNSSRTITRAAPAPRRSSGGGPGHVRRRTRGLRSQRAAPRMRPCVRRRRHRLEAHQLGPEEDGLRPLDVARPEARQATTSRAMKRSNPD